MKKHGRTQITNSTWHGPATWPQLWQEAKEKEGLTLLSVDRLNGKLIRETFGRWEHKQ